MGKYITESSKKLNVSVGETAFLQDDSNDIQIKGDRVYAVENLVINRDYFGDDFLEMLKESPARLDSTSAGATAMEASSRAYWAKRPYFKLFSFNHEITMGGYTYAPCAYSGQTTAALEYLRFDPATKSVETFAIKYVGAGSLQNITQAAGSMVLTSNGSKLFAYFLANNVIQCYTSVNGVDWTDETASFGLSGTLGTSNIHTAAYNSHQIVNGYNGLNANSTHRMFSITWCGNAFLMFFNDNVDHKFYTSSDGLNWTDVTATFCGTVTVGSTLTFVANVDIATGICMFFGGQSTSTTNWGAYSTDGGTTWNSSTVNTSIHQYYTICYKNPLDPNKMIAKVEANEIYWAITVDGGATWNDFVVPFSTYTSDANSGFAYFGDYIYVKDRSTSIQYAPVMVSSDNGSTWNYAEEFGTLSYARIFNDDHRVYIASGEHLYYSADNTTFLFRFLMNASNSQWKGAVSIDANKTLFLSESDVAWSITSDGGVTFDRIFKDARSGRPDFAYGGLNMQEIGYLSNARMVAHIQTENSSTTNTNSYWTDWIYDPQFVMLQNGTSQTGTELTPFIRTK